MKISVKKQNWPFVRKELCHCSTVQNLPSDTRSYRAFREAGLWLVKDAILPGHVVMCS